MIWGNPLLPNIVLPDGLLIPDGFSITIEDGAYVVVV